MERCFKHSGTLTGQLPPAPYTFCSVHTSSWCLVSVKHVSEASQNATGLLASEVGLSIIHSNCQFLQCPRGCGVAVTRSICFHCRSGLIRTHWQKLGKKETLIDFPSVKTSLSTHEHHFTTGGQMREQSTLAKSKQSVQHCSSYVPHPSWFWSNIYVLFVILSCFFRLAHVSASASVQAPSGSY